MSRMKDIRSLKVLHCSGVVPNIYISTHKKTRDKQYKEFADEGIELFPYEDIKRRNLKTRDLKVFMKDWSKPRLKLKITVLKFSSSL